MSKEPVSENSVVMSDLMVSLSKDDYETMLRTINGQNQKIQAFKNLHQLVQSKDNELRSSREKAQNLQAALDRAEARLVNQIRLTAASKSPLPSTLEADSAVCEAVPAETRRVAPVQTRPTTNDNRSYPPTFDIEMDGTCLVEQSPRFHEVPLTSSKAVPPPGDISGTFFKCSAPFAQSDSMHLDKNPVFQSATLKSSASSVKSLKNDDTLMSSDVTTKVSLGGNATLKSFGVTRGVSKDLLDKLMHQNARLRKVIKDILEQRGTTIESHLEQRETQDVVEQLREELRLSKQQNEKLKQIINAKDKDDLQKKYAEQGENLQKTKKTVAMLQTMVDTYGKEYEELQKENKTLKDQLSATVTTKKSEINCRAQEIDSGNLRRLYDEALGKLKAAESDRESLQLKSQKLQEMLAHCQKEMVKVNELNRRCAALEAEKQLLESQIAVFQEDYTTEHKEFLEKQQQYETTIAKHQDWIRRLVAEAQKIRSSLEEERAKRMTAETSCREIQERFRKFIVDSQSTAVSCRNPGNFQVHSPTYHDLQIDHANEAAVSQSDLCLDQGFAACSPADNTEEETGSMLVCPRCEREFERREEQKFRDHIARCTDD